MTTQSKQIKSIDNGQVSSVPIYWSHHHDFVAAKLRTIRRTLCLCGMTQSFVNKEEEEA